MFFPLRIIALLVLIAGQCNANTLTKGHFLRLTKSIDSATPIAMA